MPDRLPDRAKPERFDAIISGASFTGLALARALGAALGRDARIALIDPAKRPGSSEDARAFALSAATRRMLGVLGVWDRLADQAQEVASIEITDSSLDDGIRPVLLRYDNRIADGEPATFIVPAPALEAALRAAVEADQAVTTISSSVVSSTKGDYGIDVELREGRGVSAPILIGAEGRRSKLRDAHGIKTVGWSYGQTGIVTTIAHAKPHEGRATQHFLPGGPFAILPLLSDQGTGGRSCVTWSEESGEAARILALEDADFLDEVEKRVGGRLGTIDLAGPRQSWPLEMHLTRSYIAPRFAIVGDGAHVVHPIAGQGLNLGLRDCAALTEVLAEAARLGLDIGNAETLRRYERWRRFDSALSAATFDGLNRLFSNDGALLRAARDFGLGVVDRLPGLKARFVEEAAGLSGELPRLLKGELA
jgi:2-octaprenyl-6-methoxyphenol hydroxylase